MPTDRQIRSHVAAQFRFARFARDDYARDRAFMRAVDNAPLVTNAAFRLLARRKGWSRPYLLERVGDAMERPGDALKRILETGPADAAVPYACLIALYQRAQAGMGAPTLGRCACGCGVRTIGRQRYASDACRKREARRLMDEGPSTHGALPVKG